MKGHEPKLVRFGSLDWVAGFLGDTSLAAALQSQAHAQHSRPSRALAFLTVNDLQLDSERSGIAIVDGTITSSHDTVLSSSELDTSDNRNERVTNGGVSEMSHDDLPSAPPRQMAMLCFEDIIQSGVPAAVQQLQSGHWAKSWLSSSGKHAKDVIMLTGKQRCTVVM